MAQGSPRTCASARAFIQNNLAIHDHILHAVAVLEWIAVGRAVNDAIGIEEGNVREESRLQQATVAQADFGRAERSHFANGVFEAEQASFARINAKHAREGPKIPRMR